MTLACGKMKFAKIQFETDDAAATALYGLMQRGRITTFRDRVFIVPEPALEWLAAEKVPYQLLQTMNHDDVVQALRNTLAHPV